MEANANNKGMDIKNLHAELNKAAGLKTEIKEINGTFKGKVVSTTGHRVFGVVVELVGTGRTYITSPTGYFKMTDIPEGIYLVRFSFPGFNETEAVITVFGGEEIDLTMEFNAAA